MTVRANPYHLQNEITLRFGQDLTFVKKIHVNPCITFCVRLHTGRQNQARSQGVGEVERFPQR